MIKDVITHKSSGRGMNLRHIKGVCAPILKAGAKRESAQVAIDDDWSALRFRRVEFIKQSKQ